MTTQRDPIQQEVEHAMRASGMLPRWERLSPPPAPPQQAEYITRDPDDAGRVRVQEYVSSHNGERLWWLYVAYEGGDFIPRADDEPPFGEAVDRAIVRVENFLAWLRALRGWAPADLTEGAENHADAQV